MRYRETNQYLFPFFVAAKRIWNPTWTNFYRRTIAPNIHKSQHLYSQLATWRLTFVSHYTRCCFPNYLSPKELCQRMHLNFPKTTQMYSQFLKKHSRRTFPKLPNISPNTWYSSEEASRRVSLRLDCPWSTDSCPDFPQLAHRSSSSSKEQPETRRSWLPTDAVLTSSQFTFATVTTGWLAGTWTRTCAILSLFLPLYLCMSFSLPFPPPPPPAVPRGHKSSLCFCVLWLAHQHTKSNTSQSFSFFALPPPPSRRYQMSPILSPTRTHVARQANRSFRHRHGPVWHREPKPSVRVPFFLHRNSQYCNFAALPTEDLWSLVYSQRVWPSNLSRGEMVSFPVGGVCSLALLCYARVTRTVFHSCIHS